MAFMCLDKLKSEKWYNALARINLNSDLFIVKYEDIDENGNKQWHTANGDITSSIKYNDYVIKHDDLNEDGFPKWYYENVKLSRDKDQLKIENTKNDLLWHNTNGQLHRNGDLPATEYLSGVKEWYINGKLHRENDLPAIVLGSRGKEWYKNGELHRGNDLPAIERADGTKIWNFHGEMHRDNDLPAMEYANGNKIWCVNDKWHRLSGLPAIEHANGTKEWYIYDVKYTYEQVCNYYQILKGFGRYCLKKIRMNRLRRARWIHGELLCMPPKGSYPGGRDYHKMVSYFMSM
jgi:hypothetical protein